MSASSNRGRGRNEYQRGGYRGGHFQQTTRGGYAPRVSSGSNLPTMPKKMTEEQRQARLQNLASNAIAIKSSGKIDAMSLAHAGRPPKQMKRLYQLGDTLPPIHEINLDEYQKFIVNLIETRGDIRRLEIEKWLDKASMDTFIKAVTHDSVNPTSPNDNYEMLEHFGDASINKATTWYLKGRFPSIVARGDPGVQIISKQKAILTSKPFLAKYCEMIGLWKFIRYRELNFTYAKEGDEGFISTQIKKVTLDRSMKEDVFEAWFAALEEVIDTKEALVGVGYSVVFKIISSLYDEQQIPDKKNLLVDAKTQLKELFDRRRKYGDYLEYSTDKEKRELTLFIHFGLLDADGIVSSNSAPGDETEPFTIALGPYSTVISGMEGDYDTNQKIVEQQTAQDALNYLQKKYPDGNKFLRYGPDE